MITGAAVNCALNDTIMWKLKVANRHRPLSQKSRPSNFPHNFVKYWPIFKILSMRYSLGNLHYGNQVIPHHILNALLHYRVKKYWRWKLVSTARRQTRTHQNRDSDQTATLDSPSTGRECTMLMNFNSDCYRFDTECSQPSSIVPLSRAYFIVQLICSCKTRFVQL